MPLAGRILHLVVDKRLREHVLVDSDRQASRLDPLVSGYHGLNRTNWLLAVEALLPTIRGTLESQTDAVVKTIFMRVKNLDLKDSGVSMKRVLPVQEVLSKAPVELHQEVPPMREMYCKGKKASGKTDVPEKSVVSGKHVVSETVVSEKDVANEAHMVRETNVLFGVNQSLKAGLTRYGKRNNPRDHDTVRRGIGTPKRANTEAADMNREGVRIENGNKAADMLCWR